MIVIKRLKDLRERVDRAVFHREITGGKPCTKRPDITANFKTKKDCQILL